ncbi:hypothetical protein GCM10011390_10930 [Aureimonas endophytica]|uniref:Uncharacterized protein n=1 Tax=Aureimonas endophytica TaxID=2027858 RepID=A0A917E1U8_9HYPH|nr:hypothetical protein [Aureimonas endophytica]GGD94019.1 hypothetical protein GCM10011390_10930 [Aureimonas endophytica]
MSAKAPPVPSDNRSPKGPGGEVRADLGAAASKGAGNPDKQGQQGNSHVNTTHQGYQQDR